MNFWMQGLTFDWIIGIFYKYKSVFIYLFITYKCIYKFNHDLWIDWWWLDWLMIYGLIIYGLIDEIWIDWLIYDNELIE